MTHYHYQACYGRIMHDVTGDLLMCSWGDTLDAEREEHRLNTADRIRDQLLEWKERYQMAALVWRQERWLAEMAKIDPRAYETHYKPSRVNATKVYGTLHDVDDAEVVTKAARDAGIKIFCYVDLYDEGQPPHVDSWTHDWFPWESKFFAEHPEYYACDRLWEKKHWGVPEYCYPEVREYKCQKELAYLVEHYQWDGVFISTRGHRVAADHGDQYGFNAPVAEAFKERHGVDILTENFDLEDWRRLRGEGITQYLRDVRALCDQHGLSLGIGIPPGDHFGPPVGNIVLDWRTWVQDKIVDFIVPGHANVVGKHLRTGYGYVSSYFGGEFGLPPFPELLTDEYAPLCREHSVGLWAHLMARERLAKVYGRKYTNDMLRGVDGVNGLMWSWASKGDRMLTADLDKDPMPSPLAAEGT